MKVRDAMTPQPLVATPATSVMSARRLMTHARIRHLPVLEADRLVGIVSDRDVQLTDRALVNGLTALQSDLVTGRYRPLRSVMSSPVQTIGPDAPLSEAARRLRQARIGALPVVDEQGELLGIVTAHDCLAYVDVAAAPVRPAPGGPTRQLRPMPAGDDRPGRRTVRPVALVVHQDAATRVRLASELQAEGYFVHTCPGPLSSTRCPAMVDDPAVVCPRVPATLDLVVVDRRAEATRLPMAYRTWRPGVAIRVVEEEAEHPAVV